MVETWASAYVEVAVVLDFQPELERRRAGKVSLASMVLTICMGGRAFAGAYEGFLKDGNMYNMYNMMGLFERQAN